ncbi:DUF3971 domain-containing protein [Shewanella gelidii]|uniref:DUF3971 domain-containing protein n=1 Tax=Shewanella gelidii TaxID=1642821 RepID=A0A917JUR6_9GAMM|nr:DUF3971 domain-containing protein [Shewanella gelidii]
MPQLDEVRQELVQYVEDQYQVEVQVGKISAQWQAFGPAVTIDELVLPPQQNLPITLMIKQVHIKLDFWESVLSLSPQVENVTFTDANIAVDVDRVRLAAQHSQAVTEEGNIDWLYSLLLEQLSRYSISEVDIQLLSQTQNYRPIHITDLKWLNHGEQHQGKGFVYLDHQATADERLTLRIDLEGDGHQVQTLAGQLYLQAQSLDIGAWASRQPNPYAPQESLPLEGVVNLQAWFGIEQSRFKSGVVQFEPSWLQWDLNSEPQKFAIDSGEIHWVPTDIGWQVTSQDLQVATNGEYWPALAFGFNKQNLRTQGYVSQFDPYLLLPLLPLVPGVELEHLELWQAMEPTGLVGPIQFVEDEHGSRAATELQQLTWLPSGPIPGSKPVDLSLTWVKELLLIHAPKQSYSIDFNGAFDAPLVFEGEPFQGVFNSEEAALDITELVLNNEDLSLNATTRILFDEELHLALAAAVEVKNAGNAGRYYPVKAMGQSLVDYLNGALFAGQSNDAKVLWHGALPQYPYSQHQGVFQAGFQLNHAEYQFHPEWPTVENIELYGLFENARMDLWVDQGSLVDIPIAGAHIFIPELGERTEVKVQANVNTTGPAATTVMQQSQLADSVGKTLEIIQVRGEVSADLDLTIPLFAGQEPDIRGEVHLNKNNVFIQQPGLDLAQVSGAVSFVNDVVSGRDVQAQLFNQPTRITFDTGAIHQDFALNVQLKSTWQLDELPQELSNPLESFYAGTIDLSGAMTMIFDDTGYRIQAQVESDLMGADVKLPQTFAKRVGERRLLRAELIGDNKQSSLGIKYGKLAEFWGGFNFDQSNQLAHYDLLLGRQYKLGDTLKKQDGYIHLAMPKTELLPWMDVIQAFIDQAQSATQTSPQRTPLNSNDALAITPKQQDLFPPLQGMTGYISQLDIAGQTLDKLQLNIYPRDTTWRLDAISEQFVGNVDFYPSWREQGLKIVADKLHLSSNMTIPQDHQIGATEVVSHLPPLAVEAKEFQVDQFNLGQLVLQAGPDGKDYLIQTLRLTTPETQLQGQGRWLNQHNENLTEFEFNLKNSKFDYLSERLDLNAGIKDAPLEVKAKLNWQDAPYAFAVNKLNGKVNFELGKGVLTEVSDKGARIFSLFSLDSLLRKLSLDFSDVFGKGLYFNSFGGNLSIDQGVVKTTDTEVNAIAGNMKVRGFTDLTTQSLNYDIRFVPQLASSVPTVVLLSTSGWTMGLGAFALTKVLEPVIEVISEIRFRLTGTMDDPKLEELERKSKEIEIPESVLPSKPSNVEVPTKSSKK